MTKRNLLLGILALLLVFAMTAVGCDNDSTDNNDNGNDNTSSTGGGGNLSWTAVTDSTFVTSINAIAYANNKFVAGGQSGKMATSTDGVTWTAVSNSTFGTSHIYAIAYGNNKFVAVGDYGKIATSSDGTSWTAVTQSVFGSSDTIRAIAYGNGKFVIGGGDGKMAASSDGVTWTAISNIFDSVYKYGDEAIKAIAYGNNKFVAAGYHTTNPSTGGYGYGYMAASADGITWTAVTTSASGIYDQFAIAYGNGIFVSVGSGSQVVTSPDGTTWTVKRNGIGGAYSSSIAYGNGKFIAEKQTGSSPYPYYLETSTDGITWANVTNPFGSDSVKVFYVNGKFFAVGAGGKMAYSSN